MIAILLKTLPFFALIGLGYATVRLRFLPEAATAYLTKFVFYFALSAMLFKFAASLPLSEIFDLRLALGYLWGTAFVYGIGMAFAFWRNQDNKTAAIEAQCAAIGNTGFLGLPMLSLLLGPAAAGPIILILAIDLIIFSSVLTVLVTRRAGQGIQPALRTAGMGLVKNPMIVSIVLGLLVSVSGLGLPTPIEEFATILGGASTPVALFVIGASLAGKTAERIEIAAWISFCKLALHPALVAAGVFMFFPADPFKASVAVASAAMPVAGNVFILAQHYGVAPQRVSASILLSTVISIVTLTVVIALVS